MTGQPTDHLTGGLSCVNSVNPAIQTMIPAMYRTSISCPMAVLSLRVKFAVRTVLIFWVMRDVGTRKTGSRRSGNRRHGKPRTGLAFTLENRCGCLPCGGRLKKPVRTWPAPDFWDTRSKRKHGIFHGEL